MVGIIGIGLFIVILIIGSLLGGGNKGNEKTLATELQLHLSSTSEVIEEYQPYVKSSDLRSSSASLVSVLTNTSATITAYLTENYNTKDKDTDKKLTAAAEEAKTALNDELFAAKINGILDRIYAHKMAYEISLFLTEEEELIDKTKSEAFAANLLESQASLEVLYEQFNNFSQGN